MIARASWLLTGSLLAACASTGTPTAVASAPVPALLADPGPVPELAPDEPALAVSDGERTSGPSDSDTPAPAAPPPLPESAWQFYRERYDADGDGQVARAEYTRSEEAFVNLDMNADGVVSEVDFAKRWNQVQRRGGKPGGYFTEGVPSIGRPAPDFELRTTTGERIALSDFRGKKPVVLVFGSYT